MMQQQKLEVNRDLINPNFQSYKFNRDVTPSIFMKHLPNGHKLHRFKLSDSDYSYCHASMSSNINNLYQQHFEDNVYFVSDAGEVIGASLVKNSGDQQNGAVQFELKTLFDIPNFNTDLMHASLSFPSSNYALILLSSKHLQKFAIQKTNQNVDHLERNDYRVKLFIVKRTKIDTTGEQWDVECTLDISRKCLYSGLNQIGSSHFHLYDSSLSPNKEKLQFVIGSVNECFQMNKAGQLKSRFGAIFHCVQLQQNNIDSSQWSVSGNKRFIEDFQAANDFPKYVALGNEGDVLIVSQQRMKFSNLDDALLANDHENVFHFEQTTDHVALRLNLDTLHNGLQKVAFNSVKIDVQIGCKYLKIYISDVSSEQNVIVLEGELEQSIVAEESTHQIGPESVDGPNLLTVRLKKLTSGEPWRGNVVHISETATMQNCRISLSNDDCVEINLAAEELEEPPVNKEEMMEVEREEADAIANAKFTKAALDDFDTCDLQDSSSSLVMTRFDCQTGQVLNEYDLSAQQWLFSMLNYSTDNRFPYFVTRYDVDAFIYEPRLVAGKFEVKHIDSFPAFGYVYASKSNRRFMTFCPEVSSQQTEWNNAIIDNWMNQLLYVYNKPSSMDSKNNKQKANNGQQFLFYFNQNEMTATNSSKQMIHGLCALPTFDHCSDQRRLLARQDLKCAIYLLTEDCLRLIQF